uniref:Uncharacterized protein n=1 Tax=Heterorhabditis bacteriophora TaxID=37862 RepID=A0A1I7X6J3_HETBA
MSNILQLSPKLYEESINVALPDLVPTAQSSGFERMSFGSPNSQCSCERMASFPLYFLALSLICVVLSVEIGDDLSFNLDLIKHQPCTHSASRSLRGMNKIFRVLIYIVYKYSKSDIMIYITITNYFHSINSETVQGISRYFWSFVLQDFRSEFSIYLELRNTASKKQVPESCVKQNSDGCGGFGSCLYCNACKTFGDSLGVHAQLLLDGKPIKCTDGLPKGTYNNLKLAFCLPKMEDILRSQGLTKESFLQLVQSDDGHTLRSMGIFATVYVFDTDDEPLPADVYWSLPFNMMIKNQQVFVACHKIYGNLKVNHH